MPNELLIFDSSPLENEGLSSEVGLLLPRTFRVSKVYVTVNQLGLPLKALITPEAGANSPLCLN
jgi:hypothetical protein